MPKSMLAQRKRHAYWASMPVNTPPYRAKESVITLPTQAAATPMRIRKRRFSSRRICRVLMSLAGCGG